MLWMAAILVSLPMFFSIASYLWGKIFNDPHHFPGNSLAHFLLIALQFVAVTLLYGISLASGLLTLFFVYIIQAVGVIYFLLRHGKLDCGCFGPQISSKLSYKLAVLNGMIGVCSFMLFLWGVLGETGLTFAVSIEGLFIEFILLIFALMYVVGLLDSLYAIRAYRAIAATYVNKIRK